jgi:hypothetical protein
LGSCIPPLVHGGGVSSGTFAVRLRTGWCPKRTISSSRAVAFFSSRSSHWNCGSSMFPAAEGPATPPSETVSIAMKRNPGAGLHA